MATIYSFCKASTFSRSKCARSSFFSTNAIYQYDRDPGPDFTKPEIQKLLKSITRLEMGKIFRRRSVADNNVTYKFMTTKQLKEKYEEVSGKIEYQLQMPPIVKIRNNAPIIIAKDVTLNNFSSTKYVFTDITYGIPQTKRKVIIRHIDGTLEYAIQNIRKRMNHIYFPQDGCKIYTPKMFAPENVQKCLEQQKYEFILDRLCLQYEPYEEEFHNISSKVYIHINENRKFDDLRSTRHFGPMAFFLAWHRNIDDLLYDMVKRHYIKNCVELIILMYMLNNIEYDKSILTELSNIDQDDMNGTKSLSFGSVSDNKYQEIRNSVGKSAEGFEIDKICLPFIEDYIKNKSLKKVQLEFTIQAFKELNREKKLLYEGLIKAHGIN